MISSKFASNGCSSNHGRTYSLRLISKKHIEIISSLLEGPLLSLEYKNQYFQNSFEMDCWSKYFPQKSQCVHLWCDHLFHWWTLLKQRNQSCWADLTSSFWDWKSRLRDSSASNLSEGNHLSAALASEISNLNYNTKQGYQLKSKLKNWLPIKIS